MENINIVVGDEIEKLRLDSYISQNIGSKSRTYIQKLIKDGNIIVNGKFEKPSYIVSEGDNIYISIPKDSQINIKPENIKIDIFYEDEDIIIVNKGKGMVVHPAPGNYSGTLVNALMYHFENNLSTINGAIRPGIVHRIDKDTTGLLVVAKNDFTHLKLSEQFKIHSITREYNMIVLGNPKFDKITVDKPIGRSKKDRKKMAIDSGGRNAITHFEVIERFEQYAYIKAELETGRTHQIRVHATHLGHPILGDNVYYGGNFKIKTIGQTLHAGTLGFIHPVKDEYIEFKAELPKYFSDILNNLKDKK